jgi:hypothetical protein
VLAGHWHLEKCRNKQQLVCAEPGGAVIMLQRLRHRAWYKAHDMRWTANILQQLPHHGVVDMKRCAVAIMSRDAQADGMGAAAIRSYNLHGMPPVRSFSG